MRNLGLSGGGWGTWTRVGPAEHRLRLGARYRREIRRIAPVLRLGNTVRMASVLKTVKLPRALAAALSGAARASGRSESELMREGLERQLNRMAGLDMLSLLGPDLGVGRGPADLSSNRKRMAGYGRTRHR